MTTAFALYPDGGLIELSLPAEGSRHTMCRAIGCSMLDVVALTSRLDMWIDDEGLYNHPVNVPATLLARRYGFTWQNYHGPVVLCSVDENGNSIDLDIHQVRGLLAALSDIATP